MPVTPRPKPAFTAPVSKAPSPHVNLFLPPHEQRQPDRSQQSVETLAFQLRNTFDLYTEGVRAVKTRAPAARVLQAWADANGGDACSAADGY